MFMIGIQPFQTDHETKLWQVLSRSLGVTSSPSESRLRAAKDSDTVQADDDSGMYTIIQRYWAISFSTVWSVFGLISTATVFHGMG